MNWQYFFGSPGRRYYKAEINGVRVEQCNGQYSIGNIDTAKQKYNSEAELIKAVK